MARIRYLKPDFFKDEDVSELPFEYRLLYQGLWVLADRDGRLEDRIKRIKAEIFPYDDVDVEKGLLLLQKNKKSSGHPFIIRYEQNTQKYIQIVRWNEHQKPHHTESQSKIPPCPHQMEKGMEKGMGMEKQLEASERLTNRYLTVNSPLNIIQEAFDSDTILPVDPLKEKFTLTDCQNAAFKVGLTDKDAELYFNKYSSQGWKKNGSNGGIEIVNIAGHMAELKNRNFFTDVKSLETGKKKQTQFTEEEYEKSLRESRTA